MSVSSLKIYFFSCKFSLVFRHLVMISELIVGPIGVNQPFGQEIKVIFLPPDQSALL
jgi:hypothetical protein